MPASGPAGSPADADGLAARAALLSALLTEHFVLQSGRSTLTAESGSRSSLYPAVLSRALVATGFIGSQVSALTPFLA